MTIYPQKSLNDYIDSVAAEKNISKSEVERSISLKDFIVKEGVFPFNFFKTEKNFKKMAGNYDSVINIKKSFNLSSLAYNISGTGVKLNNLNNLK